MNITLYKSEIASRIRQPFNSLRLAQKRLLAAEILRARPGNWTGEIRILESGIPAANKFIIADAASQR